MFLSGGLSCQPQSQCEWGFTWGTDHIYIKRENDARLWDAALESARRWIAFEPQSLNPRCAEAFAQAGSQDAGLVKEARLRFAQLYKEVAKLEGEGVQNVVVELQECVWRCDELLQHLDSAEVRGHL